MRRRRAMLVAAAVIGVSAIAGGCTYRVTTPTNVYEAASKPYRVKDGWKFNDRDGREVYTRELLGYEQEP